MSTKPEKPKKKKLSKPAIVLIIACVIIAIPIVTFLVILLSASLQTGTPILGDRFKNDLNPPISSSNESAIVEKVKSLDKVDDCEIVMTSAQFRVNVDASDSISESDAESIGDKVYEIVSKELPINTYFTASSSGAKMYDLAINIYNYIPENSSDNNFISYLITKNSKMDAPSKKFNNKPVSEELAKELRGEITSSEPEEATNENGEQASE